MKRLVSCLLVFLLAMSAITATAEQTETVISFWEVGNLTTEGELHTPVADALAEATGVRINNVTSGGISDRFSILLAAGDLPDVVWYNGDNAYLARTGQLLPLDDLLEEYAPHITSSFPERLAYSREVLSDDGNIYYIPINCYSSSGEDVPAYYGVGISMMARWDIYAELGYPEINTTDDLLNFFAQAQELHPKTPDGKTMYAMGAWSSWGIWPWWIPYTFSNACIQGNNGTLVDLETGEIELQYKSEKFWEAIRFWNKAYNMGLVDPESFTQTYDDYVAKLKNGQYIYMGINGSAVAQQVNEALAEIDPSMGYEFIPTGLSYCSYTYESDNPYGWEGNFALAITRNCDNPELAMQFIDYCCSPEGSRLLINGIEGVHWETVDGKDVFTKEYIATRDADSYYLQEQGINQYIYLAGYNGYNVIDGNPIDINKSRDMMADMLTPIDEAFCAYYGEKLGKTFTYPGEAIEGLIQAGTYTTLSATNLVNTLQKGWSDDAQLISTEVDNLTKVSIPLAVMVPEDEFDAAKDAIMEELNGAGYEDLCNEVYGLIEQAKVDAAKVNE